ncbi:MAG: hypothetical protein M5U28_40060 [Sandaracinaceae bacterium]|nr:hypothetical protein [Sandaracinaceae bacterium]
MEEERNDARWGWLATLLLAPALYACIQLITPDYVIDRHLVWWASSSTFAMRIGKSPVRVATALPMVAEHASPTRHVTVDASGRTTIRGEGHEVLVSVLPGATVQTVASAIAKVRRSGDRFAIAPD